MILEWVHYSTTCRSHCIFRRNSYSGIKVRKNSGGSKTYTSQLICPINISTCLIPYRNEIVSLLHNILGKFGQISIWCDYWDEFAQEWFVLKRILVGIFKNYLTLSGPSFFLGAWARGGGGEGGGCPRLITLKLFMLEMRFGRLVQSHKLINLV